MDNASGAAANEGDPARPKISRYTVPPTVVSNPPASAPAAPPPAPAPTKPGAGAWQSIFEAGEETVRKTKAK